MVIIIAIALYLLILSILYDNKKGKERDNIPYLFTYLVFVVVAGISREVGEDMVAYLEDYSNSAKWSSSEISIKNYFLYETAIGMMPFWSLSQITFKTFSNNFYFFHFVMSAVVNAAFFITFKRYSRYKYLCVLFYFFYSYYDNNFDLLRQSLAGAFAIFAFENLFRNRITQFYVISFIALMFHTSAIILFIIPFLRFLLYKKKILISFSYLNMFKLFVLTLILYFSISIIILKIMGVFQFFSLDRYNMYFETTFNLNGAIFLFIVYLGIPFFVVKLLNKAHMLNNNIKSLLPTYFILGSFLVAVTMLSRCFNYFTAYAIVLFIDFFVTYVVKKKTKYILVAFSLTAFIIYDKFSYYVSFVYKSDRHKYEYFLPYTTAFDNKDVKFRESLYYDGTMWRGGTLDR